MVGDESFQDLPNRQSERYQVVDSHICWVLALLWKGSRYDSRQDLGYQLESQLMLGIVSSTDDPLIDRCFLRRSEVH